MPKAAPKKLDQALLGALADKVFTPQRVAVMLAEMKQQMAGDKQEYAVSDEAAGSFSPVNGSCPQKKTDIHR